MNLHPTPVDTASHLISPPVPSPLFVPGEPLKLGVLASGTGSNFEAIARTIGDGKLNAEIEILIYNNPKAGVIRRAEKFDVPAILVNHREYATRETFDAEVVKVLNQYDLDLIVFAGWMRIATRVLVEAFPHKMINLHPAILPSFPGIRGVEQALEAGVKITGCTVHFVELEVDRGPIVMQAAVPVAPDDTPETLHRRIQVLEHQIMVGAIALLQATASY
ncbi:MAG: phosphoribosylglycinamide formyltransferase [Limnospira sp.]